MNGILKTISLIGWLSSEIGDYKNGQGPIVLKNSFTAISVTAFRN